jgi:aryl-alcohol dehydrogenase-like predicted oxidoreductase
MNLSHAYGEPPDPATAARVLRRALDLGYDHFDTAALYGFGANETLVGEALAGRRDQVFLASKCGMDRGETGQREIDGRPERLERTCEDSLRRLRTETIDLYYLHRWDRRIPIEDSVGALADLVAEGKIGAIGLSEVSAATLARAQTVHPIAAVQSEYSLWTRNPEIAVLDACRRSGVAFVAFSPLARGFLAGAVRSPESLPAKDIRRPMPRFQGEAFAHNLALLDAFEAVAAERATSPAELALAWVLARGDHVLAIPGTTQEAHLADNLAAADLVLEARTLARLDAMINAGSVSGGRYPAAVQAEIDTEEFVA